MKQVKFSIAQLTAKACADPTSTADMAAVNLSADMLPEVKRRGTDGRQHRLTPRKGSRVA